MNTVLKKFVNESLFDASAALLEHLHIVFNEVTRMPVSFESLYPHAAPYRYSGEREGSPLLFEPRSRDRGPDPVHGTGPGR